MTWYKTGTISLTNGAAAVTGAGTSWVDAGVLNSGDILAPPDGNLYEILSIESNTGLTLASNYLGTTASGAAYAIMPIGLLPSALAQQVKAVLTIASAASSAAVLSTPAQGLTSTQQGNARANIAALGAADVGAGRLIKSVAGGADVTLTATEAANQFLAFTGTLTANINVIVPAAARLFAVYNATSGAYTLTVKTAAGSGVAVPQGLRGLVECDATNVVGLTVGNAASFTTLAASGNASVGGTVSALGDLVSTAGGLSLTNCGGIGYRALEAVGSSANAIGMRLSNSYAGSHTWLALAQGSGNFLIHDQTDGVDRFSIAKTTGVVTIPAGIAVEAVIAPTLVNSWVNYGGTAAPAGYWKDAFGVVHLRGCVKDGTADTTVFTLPVGYRPAVDHKGATTENNTARALAITASGVVSSISAGNTELWLEGITFKAA